MSTHNQRTCIQRKSGRGLPHSKTLRASTTVLTVRQPLECARPLGLSAEALATPSTGWLRRTGRTSDFPQTSAFGLTSLPCL